MTTLAILAVVLLLIWYYRLKPRCFNWREHERLTNGVTSAHCQYQKEQRL